MFFIDLLQNSSVYGWNKNHKIIRENRKIDVGNANISTSSTAFFLLFEYIGKEEGLMWMGNCGIWCILLYYRWHFKFFSALVGISCKFCHRLLVEREKINFSWFIRSFFFAFFVFAMLVDRFLALWGAGSFGMITMYLKG